MKSFLGVLFIFGMFAAPVYVLAYWREIVDKIKQWASKGNQIMPYRRLMMVAAAAAVVVGIGTVAVAFNGVYSTRGGQTVVFVVNRFTGAVQRCTAYGCYPIKQETK